MEIRNKDREFEQKSFFELERFPITVVLDNVRSAYNVGSVFRTADASRIHSLYLCGYTPYPPNEKVEKTALGACDYVPWVRYPSAVKAISDLKDAGVFIAAFETADKSKNYFDFDFPKPIALIFGNEKEGISSDVLDLADEVLHVPTWGIKNSLNIANVVGITVYEVIRNYGNTIPVYSSPFDVPTAGGMDL